LTIASSVLEAFSVKKKEAYAELPAFGLVMFRPVFRLSLVFHMVTAVATMKENTKAASPT